MHQSTLEDSGISESYSAVQHSTCSKIQVMESRFDNAIVEDVTVATRD
jgi:hypothetical protein